MAPDHVILGKILDSVATRPEDIRMLAPFQDVNYPEYSYPGARPDNSFVHVHGIAWPLNPDTTTSRYHDVPTPRRCPAAPGAGHADHWARIDDPVTAYVDHALRHLDVRARETRDTLATWM